MYGEIWGRDLMKEFQDLKSFQVEFLSGSEGGNRPIHRESACRPHAHLGGKSLSTVPGTAKGLIIPAGYYHKLSQYFVLNFVTVEICPLSSLDTLSPFYNKIEKKIINVGNHNHNESQTKCLFNVSCLGGKANNKYE